MLFLFINMLINAPFLVIHDPFASLYLFIINELRILVQLLPSRHNRAQLLEIDTLIKKGQFQQAIHILAWLMVKEEALLKG